MVIKYEKNISDYKYLLAFDLASHNTGVCLWDIEKNRPIKTYMVVTKKTETFVSDLYNNLEALFEKIKNEQKINLNEMFVCKEAMPVQLRGGSSTVQTFLALAKSHAILDLFLQKNNIDVYDFTGIYPATTHACLRKILGVDSKIVIDKEKIKEYIKGEFGLETQTYDESDAAFLAVTLINSKWNKDILEEIKEVKKHKKELKSSRAIADCDASIDFLNSLII